MEIVKRMMKAGISLATAIKEALSAKGVTVAGFASKYEMHPKAVSNAINGNTKATATLADGLARELGGTPDEWRLLLWESAKPAPLTRAS